MEPPPDGPQPPPLPPEPSASSVRYQGVPKPVKPVGGSPGEAVGLFIFGFIVGPIVVGVCALGRELVLLPVILILVGLGFKGPRMLSVGAIVGCVAAFLVFFALCARSLRGM